MIETLDDVPALLESESVTGLSLAYSVGDDVSAQAWGVASVSDRRRVREDTLFRAGSVSKPVTAYAALRLAAQRRLDLDADVSSMLRTRRVPSVDGWQPVVTVRMLLAHVSGVGDAGLGEIRFWTLPNVMWSYSGDGYGIVAELISEATGLDFPDAMREFVLEPLGMRSSTFEQPPAPALLSRAAHGHVRGQPIPGGWVDHPNVAAGGLWTTPSDLMRFAAAVNAGRAPEMLAAHPVEPRMGLGLFLTSHDGVDWWSHGGGVPGFECLLVGSRSGAGPFAAMAMRNTGDDSVASFEVLRLVSTLYGPGPIVLHHLLWESRGAWARMTKLHDRVAGTYVLPGGGEVALAKTPAQWGQNELVLTLPGQPPVQLSRVTDGWWRVPGLESYLVFEEPGTIRFVQAGREVRAERAG